MIKPQTTSYQLLATKFKSWIKNNKVEFAILLLILCIGAFMRLYRISEYMTFLGDEGRDVIVVRRLLVEGDLILVGPGTSIGNMYLGPLYYYMMAPALWLSGLSPVGPAVMIALLGVTTILFVWYIAREWSGGLAASISALLYAVSPIVIYYSRSSWNPNIMPFFALLSIYSIWRAWAKEEYKWILISLVSYAFVLQSHYLGLILTPVIGLFWFLSFWKLNRKLKTEKLEFVRYSVVAIAAFILLMSPLLVFDYRHGWRNYEAMKIFFTQRQTTVSARPWTALPKMWPLFEQYSTRIIAGTNELAGKWTAFFLALCSLFVLKNLRATKANKQKAIILVLVWIITAFVGFGVYKQHIYDHYFGFIFPAGFLLLGIILARIYKSFGFKGKFFVILSVVALLYFNLKENPFRYHPNRQLQRSIEVSEKIVEESKGKKLNLAVIAERNYEGAYQYFLEWWKVSFAMIDPQRLEETVADQLFVVCELPTEKCDPTHNPKAEVANFGWSKIENQWNVAGTTLFKLVHVK